MFLLVFLGLWNQFLGFIVWIPADPVQEGKAITHGDTKEPLGNEPQKSTQSCNLLEMNNSQRF